MSNKTDQAVNVSHGGDRGSPTVIVILMAESDPINPQQVTLKDATARKILSVVVLELAFVFVVTSGFFFNRTDEDICTFVKSHAWISLIALVIWAISMFRVSWCGEGSGPLLGLGNVLIFVLTTLCLTVGCVFMTICSDGEMIIQALVGTLGVLLLVVVVDVLTPLNTTGWGNQLWVMTIVLGLADFVMILTSEFLPVSIELRIILILGIIDVILSYFYILHYLQTIIGGEMDKDDGWFNACLMLFWILSTFVMIFLLCELMQVLQAEKSS